MSYLIVIVQFDLVIIRQNLAASAAPAGANYSSSYNNATL